MIRVDAAFGRWTQTHVGPKEGQERLQEGLEAIGGLRPSVNTELKFWHKHSFKITIWSTL